jgi:hypothetical protein
MKAHKRRARASADEKEPRRGRKEKLRKERPAWLLPVVTLFIALGVIVLALYASSQKTH